MTQVDTTYGKVAGVNADGVLFFKNIPYAAAPTGEDRWSAPKPPEAWTGVRQADEFGPISWQIVATEQGALSFAQDATPPVLAEDCLSLNVWTPSVDGQARPVMVWIHGGAFVTGSGSSPIYDGSILSRRGNVVVVTINYRLGVLGFLNLNEVTGGRIPSTGNEGLLDQAFALEWVKDNIARFGGDANNVTIFGESAGGMSVGALLALREANGLFHKAIPQSGAAHTANTLAQSNDVASQLLSALDISPNSNLNRLFELPAEELTRVGAEVSAKLPWMCYEPCIDGAQLSARPIDCVANGSADDVSVLVGCTRDEWLLFSVMDPTIKSMTQDDFERRLESRNGRPDLRALGQSYYEILSRDSNDVSPADVWQVLESDRGFRMPGIVLAETLNKRSNDAYQYLFTVESPAYGGILKSCHAIDIGYVFGTHNLNDGTRGFFGGEPAHIELAEATMDAWLAFAHTGNPATDALSTWSPYGKEKRSTAIFGLPVSVEDAPLEELRALWDDPSVQSAIGAL